MAKLISGARTLEHAELAIRAQRAAAAFKSLGIGRGDAVAIMLRNDFAFFEASAAIGQLGGYPVPVNWHYTEDEADYLFRNSEAKAIVIHADLLAGVSAAIPEGVPVFVVETPQEIAEAFQVSADKRRVPDGRTDWETWISGFAPLPPVLNGGLAVLAACKKSWTVL